MIHFNLEVKNLETRIHQLTLPIHRRPLPEHPVAFLPNRDNDDAVTGRYSQRGRNEQRDEHTSHPYSPLQVAKPSPTLDGSWGANDASLILNRS